MVIRFWMTGKTNLLSLAQGLLLPPGKVQTSLTALQRSFRSATGGMQNSTNLAQQLASRHRHACAALLLIGLFNLSCEAREPCRLLLLAFLRLLHIVVCDAVP